MKIAKLFQILLSLVAFQATASRLQAQWVTQSFVLKAGWNAIYLHVDASYDTLDNLVGLVPSNPIQEIWLWSINPTAAQFVTSPQSPSQQTYWTSWSRTSSPNATLKRLPGNVACLVRSTTDFTWNLKGQPVAPAYQWTDSGLNFLGFSTVPGATAPTFDTFFTPAPELKVGTKIFAYQGGPITNNPVQVLDLTTTRVTRGQAFWIRADSFNRYFGPFEVVFSTSAGPRFGNALGQTTFRIRNNTPQDLTVTLTGIASETAPAGQTAVRGAVPVLVRGSVNPTTLTYPYSALSAAPAKWTLKASGQAGSEVEVVLGVDRQKVLGSPKELYASILRFTDSLRYSQIDVPISAEVSSTAGLWVGQASVSSVNQYLNTYATAANTNELGVLLTRLGLAEGADGLHYEIDSNTQRILVFGGVKNNAGSYLLDGPAKVDPGAVARAFPLRLIVHNDGTKARLLQKAYLGLGLATNPVVATQESLLLKEQLSSARRVSAVHLPDSSANKPWDFTGAMVIGSNLTTTVALAYDDQTSNPFLHTYHPDHDNLDASFSTTLPVGFESYGVRRKITLNFIPPESDFDSVTRSGAALNGTYAEEVAFDAKLGANRTFTTRGTFSLNRINDIATLTQP